MGYEVETDADRRILRCAMEGDIAMSEGEALAISLRRRAAEEGFMLLYDLTRVAAPPPLADLFRFPRTLNDSGVPRPQRVAIVCAAHFDAYEFYETTAGNAGHNLRVFKNEDDALDWLTEPPTHMA